MNKICKRCNKRKVRTYLDKRDGRTYQKHICNTCKNYPYRIHKKDTCEVCGFIPLHPCQLDVDHIDGNHENNDISNLRTLCSNCHRLRHFAGLD